MRLTLALLLSASPAAAWDFSPSPICTLSQADETAAVTITYDASLPEYTITITLPGSTWPEAGTFGMAFLGDSPLAIQTDRHQLSVDRRSLTVADTGFGNVLNGLEFNATAVARAGETDVSIPLSGIEPAITAFRACPADTLS